ncbi:MAG: hypothetical protein H6698_05100 [Myxococcales bacterium]|nr:hypothetical protein [Myxococcales bacterium]MCB9519741.1 hypothetical protein [Myxococcales bacterium]MCB9530432.1 hypothetical protein [Myxococcales bacterium]MCB9533679.1 hypothetical protein [Myxococcales bacterium]
MPELHFPIAALNREIFTEINLGEAIIAFAIVITIVSISNSIRRRNMLKR